MYVNVTYPLEKPVNGAREFTISSLVDLVTPEELAAAGAKATLTPTLMIETFEDGWYKEWYKLNHIGLASTHKLGAAQYKAPAGASLSIEVLSSEPNKLVLQLNDSAAEIDLVGGEEWQTVVLHQSDFHFPDGTVRSDWKELRYLQLIDQTAVRSKGVDSVLQLGQKWVGATPQVRNLRWNVER